ncbi:MAG: MBL fold metallo-hydrolase, partial [Shewanella sp.]|nr:MBL fold metallo-hydrolase [Shewanella sp.]
MQKSLMTLSIIATFSLSASAAEHEHEHISLHYQGKPATQQTAEVNKATAATLNYTDKKAFEEFSKNLIAELDEPTAAILR